MLKIPNTSELSFQCTEASGSEKKRGGMAFHSHRARYRHVSASTQGQALAALRSLYRWVLKISYVE
jgi:hypothetical protein